MIDGIERTRVAQAAMADRSTLGSLDVPGDTQVGATRRGSLTRSPASGREAAGHESAAIYALQP
jgi:hypothetical protein